MTSTTAFAPHSSDAAPTLSATGRETIVLTVGPASTDHFVSLVETFGEATRSACRSLVLDLSAVDRIDSDLLGHRTVPGQMIDFVVLSPAEKRPWVSYSFRPGDLLVCFFVCRRSAWPPSPHSFV